MPKFPKPWFRPSRGVWYVTLDGNQINLGSDRTAAFIEYARLIAEPKANRKVSADSLAGTIDAFLEWLKRERSAGTYGWFRYRLERFARKYPDMRTADVRPYHVQQWVDEYRFSVTSRRNYMRSVKRCLAWATKQGYLDKNPVDGLEIPSADHREVMVTQAEFDAILANAKNESFKALITVTWETGCRPQESLRVEARHVDLANQRWVFPKSESKNKKISRVVYLTDKAIKIVRRLVKEHPTGKLFRNTDEIPWTTSAVNCTFGRMKAKLKKRYSLYALRHAWATNALQKGVDPLTVAILMGHSDPSMLSKVYQHVSLNPAHMLGQAKKAVG